MGDIRVGTEGISDAIKALSGMADSDFAIITGLNFVVGTPNTYTTGIIYFNGNFYYVANGFNENQYLVPQINDTLIEAFNTGSPQPIYSLYNAVDTSSSFGATIQFNGNMNQYRIGNKYFRDAIISLLATQAALGTASTRNIGTSTGQILTADQTYTATQIDAKLAAKSPSYVGEIKEIMPLTSLQNTAFLALFNGSGEGVTFPFVGWHLLNGEDGYPDMTGRKFVGVGSGYVYATPGGSNTVTLDADNIPPLSTDAQFASGPGSSVTAYIKINDSAGGFTSVPVNAGSPTDPIDVENAYMPVYMVYRHT